MFHVEQMGWEILFEVWIEFKKLVGANFDGMFLLPPVWYVLGLFSG